MNFIKQRFGNFLALSFMALGACNVMGQTTLTTADYTKALWMTTRFFGGQRLTDNTKSELQQNWLVQDYLPSGVSAAKKGVVFAQDADNGYDLSGGWADCGDHVFFGQTGFYAGYMLLKNYDVFPEGFDDYYDAYYTGYRNSGDYSWEGGKGTPNGIPDVLDEVKHQTDLFIKMAKNSTTFYYEKGDGNADHTQRVTAVKMQTNSVGTGGEPRKMWSNPNDASMPAMCAATLALMSKKYRPFDPAYADLCLVHAKYAYDYSMSKSSVVGAASGSFYGGNDNFNNGRAIMFAEMFKATGTASYKTQALALSAGTSTQTVRPNINYTFDYSNTGEVALYCLAEIGHTSAKTAFLSHIQNKFIAAGNYNSAGVYKNGGGWGKLRYVGNAAMLIAMYNKMNNSATLDPKVYANVDYILGKNSGNWSYLVGFVPQDISPVVKTPGQAHHRNLYLYEGNNNNTVVTIPNKNKQFGALVGGSLDGTYNDLWTDYVNTEVCVDYNVGIVGALAAIRKEKNPVDTNKFLAQCASPKLGADQSLCGISGGITLNSGLTNNNVRTFQWFKDGVSQGAASKTATTFKATTGGEWSVKVDSLGKCSRTDVVIISATLPSIDLGPDVVLCSPITETLTTGLTGSAISHAWSFNNINLTSANTNTYVASQAGTYKVTVSASGCTSVSDEVVVSSNLPTTQGDVFCPSNINKKAQLLVTSAGGPFQWFATATSTTVLGTGAMFEVQPTATTTYFVKDAGTFNGAVGPTATGGTLNAWGSSDYSNGFYLKFSPNKNFNITALSVPFNSIYSNHSGVVSIDILTNTGTVLGNFTSDPKSLTTTNTGLIEFTFTDFAIQASWGTELFMALNKTKTTVNGGLIWQQGGSISFPYTSPNGPVSITGANTQGQSGTNYVYFYNWKISSGTSCDRKPVTATQDCTVGLSDLSEVQIAQIYPNPSDQSATIEISNKENAEVKIFNINGLLLEEFNTSEKSSFGMQLPSGIYVISITHSLGTESIKFIKR